MSKKILLIVEGEKTEPRLFKRIQSLLNVNNEDFEIISFKTNIYTLFKKMKDNDFNVSIKYLLKEMYPLKENILNQTFIYTYLIFDLDAHHRNLKDARDINLVVDSNLKETLEMVKYFTNETDDTIGKLYINYPMIESFKDSNDYFDYDFKNTEVSLMNLSRYKEIVSKKKLSNVRVDSISDSNLNKLILQNIFKLNYISSNSFESLDYKAYLNYSSQESIFFKELELIKNEFKVSVINTSFFLVIDYFGNNNHYYDDFISNTLSSIN